MCYFQITYGTRWHGQYLATDSPATPSNEQNTETQQTPPKRCITPDERHPCISPNRRIPYPSEAEIYEFTDHYRKPNIKSYAQENEMPPRHVPPLLRIPISTRRMYASPDLNMNKPSEDYFKFSNNFAELISNTQSEVQGFIDLLPHPVDEPTYSEEELYEF